MKLTYDEIQTTHYEVLKNLPKKDIDEIAWTVVEHYRKEGFPYFDLDYDKVNMEFLALRKSNHRNLLLENNEIQQSMVGLASCNMFHPEMYSVKCGNALSPMEIFRDDDLFHTAIVKRIKYNDRPLNKSCVRRALTAFGGQSVSNFRPSVAKWVYKTFANSNSCVLDPCSGYGGRAFGALAAGVKEYVGVDPNIHSVSGTKLLTTYIDTNFTNIPWLFHVCRPFEETQFLPKFDLVFTSPPYYDKEKYAENDWQSYVRYNTYEKWVAGFLEPLIKKSYDYLKEGGYLVLNVGEPITNDTLRLGSKIFGYLPETYHMRLSKFLGQKNKHIVKFKTEPIFVWKKVQNEKG